MVNGTTPEQAYSFTLGLGLQVEGREVPLELYARYDKSAGAAYELDLTGALQLDGFQLAVAFDKTSGPGEGKPKGKPNTLILGSLQTPLNPLKLQAKDLIHALAPDLDDDVPFDVEIELPGLLLGMDFETSFQGTSSASVVSKPLREYLFRLNFVLDFTLAASR